MAPELRLMESVRSPPASSQNSVACERGPTSQQRIRHWLSRSRCHSHHCWRVFSKLRSSEFQLQRSKCLRSEDTHELRVVPDNIHVERLVHRPRNTCHPLRRNRHLHKGHRISCADESKVSDRRRCSTENHWRFSAGRHATVRSVDISDFTIIVPTRFTMR